MCVFYKQLHCAGSLLSASSLSEAFTHLSSLSMLVKGPLQDLHFCSRTWTYSTVFNAALQFCSNFSLDRRFLLLYPLSFTIIQNFDKICCDFLYRNWQAFVDSHQKLANICGQSWNTLCFKLVVRTWRWLWSKLVKNGQVPFTV